MLQRKCNYILFDGKYFERIRLKAQTECQIGCQNKKDITLTSDLFDITQIGRWKNKDTNNNSIPFITWLPKNDFKAEFS